MSQPLTPLADRVIATRDEAQTRTASGLYLPDSAKEKAMIAEETERLHLSAEDVMRLTLEAREAIKERQREDKHASAAYVINPHDQPQLAAQQWKLLVSQLQLLTSMTDKDELEKLLQDKSESAALYERVLKAVRD